MWNKAKCILLETKENSGLLLGLSKFGRLISYDTECTNPNNDVYSVKQHLYIINDDVIKEGDWCYIKNRVDGEFIDKVSKTTDKGIWTQNDNYYYPYKVDSNTICKKIIATTDKGLFKVGEYNPLPQIPQSFIEQYITEYNKGSIISNVLVECEDIHLLPFNDGRLPIWRKELPLKLTNNTINIKTVKDSFSREEYEIGLRKAFQAGAMHCATEGKIYGQSIGVDKFIEQNL